MKLRELAHTRTGDKGNRSTLTVIAYEARDFARLETQLTAQRVKAHYDGIVLGRVERYALPQLAPCSLCFTRRWPEASPAHWRRMPTARP